MNKRIHNFNPGPAALPLEVLEQIREELLDLRGSRMSILELSHRSKLFEEIIYSAKQRVRRLLGLDERFHVLFLQGGASLQFCMVPMNLLGPGRYADYVNTGHWSINAIKEAQIQGRRINVVASSEDRDFCYIPKEIPVTLGSAYLHLTSNNTIKGTQWHEFPDTGEVPLVSDMSSDIMSRRFDPGRFGLIYAGAQKNLGPAGATLVIIRGDMLEAAEENIPTMLKYKTHVEKDSMFNTPSCFAIYVIELVLKWLEETIGGIEAVEEINNQKAELLYECLDNIPLYNGFADRDSRSKMNVVFRLTDGRLEERFLLEAEKEGLGGLKGHRSVGGCRASIYNAVGLDSVRVLVDFMRDFARRNG